MESKIKKCFCQKHKEEIANVYCKNCNIYMCNKCLEYHSKLFENHLLSKNDNDDPDLFTGYCKEENHLELLEFFCKNHNKLCCSSCICKIKSKKYGKHKDCDVCIINDIKEEKKSRLKENIKHLEEISNNIKEAINSIKIIYDKMSEKKEELKLNVQKIFTKIRNTINNREDELLLEIDKKYEEFYLKEESMKEIEKLPKKIELSLEKGKILDKEWDNESKLNITINYCINIEKNIKYINEINDKIKRFNNNEINIHFYPIEENLINSYLENIKKFGSIVNDDFLINSKIISNNQEYILSLKNWINEGQNDKNIKSKLLYRLSDNGEKFSTFHELCDNKGQTLTLFHINDGNKVGIFSPLSWDSITNDWKKDEKTFIFNLNKNTKCKNINKNSLFCKANHGTYTDNFGIGASCKDMKRLVLHGRFIDSSYENGSSILKNNRETIYFDLLEVEVFKIEK